MKVRIAKNESLFRAMNEAIELEAESIGVGADPVPFVCECPDPSCTELVELTLVEYEEVRTGPTRFFVVPGHQALDVQANAAVVVEERDDVVIADKIGIAGEVAAAYHGKDLKAERESDDMVVTDEAREERLAQNEVVFRTVNEAIEQKAIELGGLDEYEFLCECSSAACFDRISLTLREYEHVRSEGVRFFVTPGHENVEVELVVESQSTFSIVEKDGAAGTVAEFADPRDGDISSTRSSKAPE